MKKQKISFKKKSALMAVSLIGVTVGNLTFAAQTSTKFNQTIKDGEKAVDIVDSNGESVDIPSINFDELDFSFESQTTEATFGVEEQKLRIQNPTENSIWSVNIAAANATDLWEGDNGSYDFNDVNADEDSTNDVDAVGGQMTINPAAGVLDGLANCGTGDITIGSGSSFVEGVTDSIDLLTAGENASPYCRWEMTDIPLSQIIPAAQPGGSYAIDMVLTLS